MDLERETRVDTSAQYLRRLELLIQYKAIFRADAGPSSVTLAPSPTDIDLWFGVLMPRSGPYAGGVYRFGVSLPLEFPSERPLVRFSTDVFHPLVNHTGTFVAPPGPGPADLGAITRMLDRAMHPETWDDLLAAPAAAVPNTAALQLFRDDPAAFAQIARKSALASNLDTELYSQDSPDRELADNSLTFSRLDDAAYDHVKAEVRTFDQTLPLLPQHMEFASTAEIPAKVAAFSRMLGTLHAMAPIRSL